MNRLDNATGAGIPRSISGVSKAVKAEELAGDAEDADHEGAVVGEDDDGGGATETLGEALATAWEEGGGCRFSQPMSRTHRHVDVIHRVRYA